MRQHEVTQMLGMVDYGMKMTARKSCKYGKDEAFYNLLLLFNLLFSGDCAVLQRIHFCLTALCKKKMQSVPQTVRGERERLLKNIAQKEESISKCRKENKKIQVLMHGFI